MRNIKLLPVEKATIAYIIITTIYLLLFIGKLDSPWIYFGIRVGVTLAILLLAWLEKDKFNPVVSFIRYVFPFALLSYWYPETYYYNEFIFPNLDSYFIAADQALFGCQPSLEFSKWLPQAWFSELMYFGYFSYYFIFFGTALWCYIYKKEIANKAVFMFVCSFYFYYVVFIILPVVGPQFYYSPPVSEVPDGYLFSRIMRFLQATGEKPTGAFPSSHVGITFTVIIFMYRYCRHLLKYALPLFFILVLSTVYIKAHYVIDVIGGFISAALFYPMVRWIYGKFDVKSHQAS
ncbi:MAG: phosphatase PAP2 family protein [Bacteroidales bacterium]|jgi:membrane-associated phospholipid phosphatase|nr:phosphatase PAP2 family protein [Bacteroidales bacterium]